MEVLPVTARCDSTSNDTARQSQKCPYKAIPTQYTSSCTPACIHPHPFWHAYKSSPRNNYSGASLVCDRKGFFSSVLDPLIWGMGVVVPKSSSPLTCHLAASSSSHRFSSLSFYLFVQSNRSFVASIIIFPPYRHSTLSLSRHSSEHPFSEHPPFFFCQRRHVAHRLERAVQRQRLHDGIQRWVRSRVIPEGMGMLEVRGGKVAGASAATTDWRARLLCIYIGGVRDTGTFGSRRVGSGVVRRVGWVFIHSASYCAGTET